LVTVDKNEILSSYEVLINNRLFLQSDIQLTDSAYAFLQDNLLDSALKVDISEIHFTNYARYFAQKSELIKSLEYSTKAFAINPKNVNTQALITQCLVQDLSRRSGSFGTLKKMDDYQVAFPFLNENNLFQSLYFYTYAYQALNHLHADDLDKGLEYLGLLEGLIDRFGDELRYDENQFGMVYAEAGAAYFRERKYSTAKKIIEKGLSRIPDHPELKIRLEIVIDEMN
jgi:tetratricopeptide (TPR) repeat protein